MKLREFELAAANLKGVIHKTPVNSSRTFSEMSGAELFLKCENLQKTGSFKVRGMTRSRRREVGLPMLFASSAGNHAQGVAYAAAMGAKSTIVMPRTRADADLGDEGYSAVVVLAGDARQTSTRLCEQGSSSTVRRPGVIAGQAHAGTTESRPSRDPRAGRRRRRSRAWRRASSRRCAYGSACRPRAAMVKLLREEGLCTDGLDDRRRHRGQKRACSPRN